MPEEHLAAKELRGVIDRAIAALPVRQRRVIVARDVVGMDAAEAAGVLGVTVGNQRVLLHRARSKVRAALEGHAADRQQHAPDATAPSDPGGGR
jgi:RNA polymerase sigma-70 factor (ECF subfamily)